MPGGDKTGPILRERGFGKRAGTEKMNGLFICGTR